MRINQVVLTDFPYLAQMSEGYWECLNPTSLNKPRYLLRIMSWRCFLLMLPVLHSSRRHVTDMCDQPFRLRILDIYGNWLLNILSASIVQLFPMWLLPLRSGKMSFSNFRIRFPSFTPPFLFSTHENVKRML